VLVRFQEANPAAEELDSAIQQYVVDYNTGDVTQVMRHWANDADFVDIRGRFWEGKEVISALFRRGFADNPNRQIELQSAARKFLAPAVAMDDGILQLTDTDGGTHRGRYSVVWTQVNGVWQIRSARDIPLEEESAAETLASAPLEELEWLVGKWEAKSEKHTIALDCQWQLDKKFLVQNYHVKSDEDDFQLTTYITFDPVEARFRSWFFDSRGGFGGGAWSLSGDVYSSAVVSVLPDGQLGSSTMSWRREGNDKAVWRAVDREIGGEPLPDALQTYIRLK
jgi:uncharacterized protein (TIGR02246 family)